MCVYVCGWREGAEGEGETGRQRDRAREREREIKKVGKLKGD